ncbi:phosphatase PAP2 family protein [Corynebacterium kutscheri]|nr:phosphatase PAP2 family protein [Corynebacterium kutscheri]
MAYDHNYARLNWLLLPITVITAAVVSRTLKHVIDRPRPPLAGQLIYEFNPSMPSGHTVAAFAFVGSISFIWRKWWLIFLWILAVIIAVSRLYIGVHWLSDVVVGALVGLAVSYCVFVIWQRYVCHRFLVSDSNR